MKIFITLSAFFLLCGMGLCSPFPEIVRDRISSKEGAETLAGDLAMAFPDRVTEIIEAIGAERPEWVIAAAVAVVRLLPERREEAVRGVRPAVQPELWSCLDTAITDQGAD